MFTCGVSIVRSKCALFTEIRVGFCDAEHIVYNCTQVHIISTACAGARLALRRVWPIILIVEFCSRFSVYNDDIRACQVVLLAAEKSHSSEGPLQKTSNVFS